MIGGEVQIFALKSTSCVTSGRERSTSGVKGLLLVLDSRTEVRDGEKGCRVLGAEMAHVRCWAVTLITGSMSGSALAQGLAVLTLACVRHGSEAQCQLTNCVTLEKLFRQLMPQLPSL